MLDTKMARAFSKTFLVSMLLLAALNLSLFKLTNFDLWLHLGTGKYVLQTKTIPQTDPFSFTAQGVSWVAHEWLFGVIFYGLYQMLGAVGLVLVKVALIMLTLLLVLRSNEVSLRNHWLSVPLLFLALIFSRFRFMLGPELFTLLFLALYYFAYRRWRAGQSWWGLVFPLTMIFWVNLHAGSIFGLIFLVLMLLGEILQRYFPRTVEKPLATPQILILGLLLGASFAAALLNPYTYRILLLPFTLKTMQNIPHLRLSEWAPFTFSEQPLLFLYFGAITGWLLYRWRRLSFPQILLYAFYSFLMLSARRGVLNWAILAVPLIEPTLRPTSTETTSPWRPLAFAQILGLSMVLFSAGLAIRPSPVFRFGLGINTENMPVKAVDFVEQENLRGRLYNSYRWGGYLIWRLGPDRQVFLDGRAEIYQGVFRYRSSYNVPQLIDYYNADYLLVDYQANLPFSVDFEPDRKKWALVFWDDAARIYLKRLPRFAPIIRRHEYFLARPNDNSLNFIWANLRELPKLEWEIQRSLAISADDFRAQIFLAGLRYAQNQPQAGRDIFQAALKKRPYSTAAYFSLANLLHRLNQETAALEYIEAGFKKEPAHEADYELWGNILAALQEYEKAISVYEKGLKKQPRDFRLNYFLGYTQLELKNYPAAEKYLLIAYQLEPDNNRTWPALAQLYAAQGEHQKAQEFAALIQQQK